MIFTPRCSVCGKEAARIEVLSPAELEHLLPSLSELTRQEYSRDPGSHYLSYRGPGGGNNGMIINATQAQEILEGILNPYDPELMHKAFHDRAGLCPQCLKYYCPIHWSIDGSGSGVCPQGHIHCLDPHWSPPDIWDDDD